MSVATCSHASGATQDSCKACCTTPPDGVQHGDLWKGVCNFLCWVHLKGKGVAAGGIQNYLPGSGSGCTACSSASAQAIAHGNPNAPGLGFAARPVHYKYIPGFVGFGAAGDSTGTTTAPKPFYHLCDTPAFTVPKSAVIGMGALALFGLFYSPKRQSSPLVKTLLNAAMGGVGAVGAGYITGCVAVS